jgi:hypothetical protein
MMLSLPEFSLNMLLLNSVTVLFLTGFILYVFFAFIAIRQIEVMRKTVITPLSSTIQLLGYLHFLLAVGATVFAFFYLL